MKNALSTWAKNISPSPTLAVDAKAKKLKSEGKDVCGFGAGEPDFDTPEFIKEACIKAIEAGKTKYLPSAGLPALREALAAHYAKRRGISYNASNFIVSPGGKFSCYLAIMSVISPGDEVIIPAPYWVSYPEMVKLAGGTPVYVKATDAADFKVTVQQLESVCTPKTKLLILTSPSNPTGAVYSAQELKEIMDFAIARDILVMSDEIYSTLVYDGVEAISPASLSEEAKEHTIVVSGFSKAFSMTGWRLGTLCAPDAIAKAVANLQSQTSSNATSFAQYGALAAMENEALADAAVAEMKKSFDRRRLMLLEGLNAIDGVFCRRAQGAFYLFPNISSFGMASVDFCAKLLEEKLVAVVPGSAFGSDENVRFSYAVSDETIQKGIERMAQFCSEIR
ncbi:MAG TPA: pyridoxal phosphate-dependent aminotransferase [Candidatus Merdousia gallistercoris]|nr:pyridoxal phosphate-dependent aminotransferase [Candidatus Merdousia gallistercoris]